MAAGMAGRARAGRAGARGAGAAARAAGPRAQIAQAKRQAAFAAALVAPAVVPLAAQAAGTPSLSNAINSVFAGAAVLGAIGGALVGVANFDKTERR